MATIIRLNDLIDSLTTIREEYGDVIVTTWGADEAHGAPETQLLTEISVGVDRGRDRKVILEFNA